MKIECCKKINYSLQEYPLIIMYACNFQIVLCNFNLRDVTSNMPLTAMYTQNISLLIACTYYTLTIKYNNWRKIMFKDQVSLVYITVNCMPL